MKPLHLRATADSDGILRLEIPVEAVGAEHDVFIVVHVAAEGAGEEAIVFSPSMEVEQEEDGRWFAECLDMPGAFAHGQTRGEAIKRAAALGVRLFAEQLECGESLDQVQP
jgi:hypothetical protein